MEIEKECDCKDENNSESSECQIPLSEIKNLIPAEDQIQSEEDVQLFDDEEVIVKERELERLKQLLPTFLKSERLCDLIKKINGSSNPKRDLSRELDNNIHFKEFIDVMLKTVGYLTEEGQFVVPD